jgi:hypothetical protein
MPSVLVFEGFRSKNVQRSEILIEMQRRRYIELDDLVKLYSSVTPQQALMYRQIDEAFSVMY